LGYILLVLIASLIAYLTWDYQSREAVRHQEQQHIWEISPRVNSPENNDPGIIDPIPDDTGDWKLAGS